VELGAGLERERAWNLERAWSLERLQLDPCRTQVRKEDFFFVLQEKKKKKKVMASPSSFSLCHGACNASSERKLRRASELAAANSELQIGPELAELQRASELAVASSELRIGPELATASSELRIGPELATASSELRIGPELATASSELRSLLLGQQASSSGACYSASKLQAPESSRACVATRASELACCWNVASSESSGACLLLERSKLRKLRSLLAVATQQVPEDLRLRSLLAAAT